MSMCDAKKNYSLHVGPWLHVEYSAWSPSIIKDTPGMMTPPLIRTLPGTSYVEFTNRDIFSCPKGVRSGEVPLYVL